MLRCDGPVGIHFRFSWDRTTYTIRPARTPVSASALSAYNSRMESKDASPVNAVAGNADIPVATPAGTPVDPAPDAKSAEPSQATGSAMLKPIRQVVVFVLGMSVVMVGIAMIVLPGPATVVIPAGLAILATEFVWAARWLKYLKNRAMDVVEWSTTQKSPGKDSSAKDAGIAAGNSEASPPGP
jgi:uncharacterized protein (TIGR02611 family)